MSNGETFKEIYRCTWGKGKAVVFLDVDGYLLIARITKSRIYRYAKPPGNTWMLRTRRTHPGWQLPGPSIFTTLCMIELEALQSLQGSAM